MSGTIIANPTQVNLADTELLSIIAYMRTANWLDNNDSLTERTPSTATHAQHIVDECKTRGLI